MNSTTVIIGAGISGLVLARELVTAGVHVTVLEKSRGYGGRMATKRVGEAVFDQGAQYFTVRDAKFIELTQNWRNAGLIKNWPDTPHRRVVGNPSMTAVPKALAEGLEILREHKVTAARRIAGGYWDLDVENHGVIRADRLLFTCPVPQALAVLAAGEVELPAGEAASLAALQYHPCLALLVTLAGPSAVPAEGLVLTEGPVRWIADNVKKGIAQGAAAAVTIHASAEFSAANYGMPEAEVAARLLPVVQAWLGSPAVSTTLHRWKFSEPVTTHAERCVWLPELALGLAGDAFAGSKVEGAVMSALAMAERLRG
ncbi:NAD(P)/FAD-dependent oxidoreductase [Rariglobus hedericola]|uniref:FAD-dependent oxidoreductase n=1 Tax=Rariglobus hedericola TaxID=2597822 RepID=A0A556QNN1_9BACT|nr:FAD-dependent oxidoreductase [Rariglobus hedericola]TSJ78243.1 FAD-dependent oxidoreductase [Rariglobus hedericola]